MALLKNDVKKRSEQLLFDIATQRWDKFTLKFHIYLFMFLQKIKLNKTSVVREFVVLASFSPVFGFDLFAHLNKSGDEISVGNGINCKIIYVARLISVLFKGVLLVILSSNSAPIVTTITFINNVCYLAFIRRLILNTKPNIWINKFAQGQRIKIHFKMLGWFMQRFCIHRDVCLKYLNFLSIYIFKINLCPFNKLKQKTTEAE